MKLLRMATLCCLLAKPAFADNWPQWRGPKNDGISSEKGLPTEWSETKNVVWKVKLPGLEQMWSYEVYLLVNLSEAGQPLKVK